jgi:multimeric flavodoxin WrbA
VGVTTASRINRKADKMQIASILGSPRKKGNTNKVLGWVEEELQSQDNQVNRINLVDHKINGCKGCYTCKKFPDKPGCPQKDEAVEVLEHLIASEIVLYSTPIYMWSPTSQMKTLMDRHCSLVTGLGTPQWQSLLEGKKTGLVITCEDGVENNADLVMELFKRFSGYLKCDYAGALVIPFTSTPDALGSEIKDQATAYAHKMTGK